MATTVLQAIQEANTSAGITTLSYANSQEFKAFMDKFAFTDYPVNLVLPFTESGVFINRGNKDVVTITGYVWKRVPEDGNDWRTMAVETSYINPMRILAKKFIRALLNTDIVDAEVESVSYTTTPEYAETSGHLFGVRYTVQLPTNINVCI